MWSFENRQQGSIMCGLSSQQTNPLNKRAIKKADHLSKRDQAYGHAIDLLKYEGEMLWLILSACIVVNVLLVGFLAQCVIAKDADFEKVRVTCGIGGVIGFLLSIAWYGTFLRNSAYYKFRMWQAKELEDKSFELLNNKGFDFAEGKEVTINGEKFQLKGLSRYMKNKRAGAILIIVFAVIYILTTAYCCWYEFIDHLFKIAINSLIK